MANQAVSALILQAAGGYYRFPVGSTVTPTEDILRVLTPDGTKYALPRADYVPPHTLVLGQDNLGEANLG